MQKVAKKSKKVEEPADMQEPGKRKRKEVESTKAIAKAGKASKQSKKKDEEDAAVAAAKKKKKKPVDSYSSSSSSSDTDSDSDSDSSSSSSSSSSDSDSDEQMAPETPKVSNDDAKEASDGDASVDENHVSNFNLSKEVCARLETKGITSLYSIQAQCFQPILDGKDLVGRARTGCGKTLAIVLPIVEVINRENPMPASGRRVQGRRPVVALLAPTRELAKQVHSDFQHIGQAFGLTSICVYGGAPYGEQERALLLNRLQARLRISQHPAIVAWLIGNELNGFWNEYVCDDGYAELHLPHDHCVLGESGVELCQLVDSMCAIVKGFGFMCSTPFAGTSPPKQYLRGGAAALVRLPRLGADLRGHEALPPVGVRGGADARRAAHRLLGRQPVPWPRLWQHVRRLRHAHPAPADGR